MTIDLVESGDPASPTLVFLPGSFSTHAAWRGVQSALTGTYRMIAVSLPGYGGTPEFRTPEAAELDRTLDWLDDVIRQNDARNATLVGHSYGGLVALAAALRGDIPVAGAITFEANPVACRPASGAYPWWDELALHVERYVQAVADGDMDAARLVIDFWGREGTYAAMPGAFRDFCRATVRNNVLDWAGAMRFRPRVTDFAKLSQPVTLVRSEHAHPALWQITGELAAQLPTATLETVDDSDHFLISGKPADCARIIDGHMGRHSHGLRES